MHQVWCITEFLSTKYPLKARKVWKATEWLEGMYTQQLRNATQNEHHKLTCAFHWSCHFWLPCKSLLTFVCCYVRKTWVHVQANPSPLYSLEWYGYIDLTPSYQTHLLALSNRNEVYIHFIQQPVTVLHFFFLNTESFQILRYFLYTKFTLPGKYFPNLFHSLYLQRHIVHFKTA